VERRLAAILAADVVGYTRLMAADELGTLRRLTELRQEVLEPLLAGYRGRLVKLMGDGLLVEFPSLLDAVECALAWQRTVPGHEAKRAEDSRLSFRIGIHLGDVIFEEGDIYGDGVNLASRLEGLAEPDGICLSGDAYRQVRGKVQAAFEDLGAREVKNLDRPVRVYRVAGVAAPAAAPAAGHAVAPALDKPSVAVLPFTNLSGDREQEYFSDGITEDITAALSRFRELTVIARNTCFTYKGKAVNIKEVARALGVRYVVEGSVRRGGDRVRVTVQLIDAARDAHIWAERYDRVLADIFVVQDEITEAVVAAVAPETLKAEIGRVSGHQDPGDLGVWDQVMRARFHMNALERRDGEIAHALLAGAIAEMPGFGLAHSTRAVCHLNDMLNSWCDDPAGAIEAAERSARRAVALDDGDASAIAVLGIAAMFARRYEASLDLLRRATDLNPNLAAGFGFLATLHGVMGNYDGCLENLMRALRLSPLDPMRAYWFAGRGIAAYIDGRYEEVVENAEAMLREVPNNGPALRQLAAALAMLGRDDDARAAMANLRRHMPSLTVSRVGQMIPVRDAAANERWLEGLRRAGLPE
jgi:TolB-like protein